MSGYLYIMSNKLRGTLYTGATSDIIQRIYEHKNGLRCEFTKRYNLKKLVYYEVHDNILSAYAREKKLKRWRRQWKNELIEKMNPTWECLYESIVH